MGPTRTRKIEALIAELFEASGVSRRWGDLLASRERVTQAQWQTLWTASDGAYTVPQIARRLGVSRQNVQRISNELIASGLATFTPNPDHKASPLLSLTPAGRERLTRVNAAAERGNQTLLVEMTEADVDQLRHLLARLSGAVTELMKVEHTQSQTNISSSSR